MCLLSSVEFLCLAWRNDAVMMWFLYLVLKSFSVSPMYVSVVLSLRVTVAWFIIDDCRQFPSSGHVFFCRQLHVLLLLMVAVTAVVSSVCIGADRMRLLYGFRLFVSCCSCSCK